MIPQHMKERFTGEILGTNQISDVIFTTLFQSGDFPESALVIDPDGNIITINNKAAERLNIQSGVSEPCNLFSFLPRHIRDSRRYHIQEVIQTRKPVIFEDFPDGSAEINYLLPLPCTGRDVEAIVYLGIHNPERRETDYYTAESQAPCQLPVEFNSEPVYICTATHMLYANQEGLNLLGARDLEDIIGRAVSDFSVTDDTLHIPDFVDRCLTHGTPSELFEHCIRRLDGEVIFVEARLLPTSFDGKTAINVISRDITSFREAEQAIKIHNRQLSIINHLIRVANSSLIVDEMMDIILKMTLELLDFDAGGIYLKNKDSITASLVAWEKIPDQFLDRMNSINFHDWPFNVVFLGGQSHYVANTPDDQPGMIDTRLLEESHLISYAGIPIIADSLVLGAIYLGRREQCGFHDQERAILELIGKEVGSTIFRGMLQEKLETANDEANCYLDIMEHDIKSAISNFCENAMIVRNLLEGPESHFGDQLLSSSQVVTQILDNVSVIRNTSKNIRGFGPVDLDGVIRGVINRFPFADISFNETGITVCADDMLPTLFTNLVGNSIKFGGAEVKIWIEVRDTGKIINVSVIDTGPGIPDKQKQDAFNFSKKMASIANEKGLGFYIASILAERYGGEIWVEDRVPGISTEGVAIKFTLAPFEG